ncbi:hypothetical protein HDF16_005483 [Granulicella aggregans]|uniref:Luciferase-like domain-containing protein n=1 Tax=Granulicella aggregans TaxID=474949 RepID=A0A7W7ZJ54_9BACT|nr:LLM class flavin-dependent oxidoreductase [Granulicella aggregans]MBB5060747.1 hypothetical protein [Granulicella aggregans]
MQIGALELCLRGYDESIATQVTKLTELAVHLEQMGYDRLWLTEHHSENFVHASPLILLPILASSTTQIKIGVGGLLLRYYLVGRLANDVAFLNQIYPDRIEIGLGRGRPNVGREVGLITEATSATYPALVSEFDTQLRTRALPVPVAKTSDRSQIWMLGSHHESCTVASALELPYVHAGFLDKEFQNVPVIKPLHLAISGIINNSNYSALRAIYDNDKIKVIPQVYGGPESATKQLADIVHRFDPTSLLYMDLSQSFEQKLRSYELFYQLAKLVARETNQEFAERSTCH